MKYLNFKILTLHFCKVKLISRKNIKFVKSLALGDVNKQGPIRLRVTQGISVRHITFIFSYRHCEKNHVLQHKTASEIKNHPDMNLELKSNS